MSGDVRVKVTVDHMRDEIAEYIAVSVGNRTEQIADAVRAAVDTFDFDTAVHRICQRELETFVADATRTYFRRMLDTPEAYTAVLHELTNTLQGDQT
jgi:predicted ATPase